MRHLTEARVTELRGRGAIPDVEVRRIRDVEALRTELYLEGLLDGKVFEQRYVHVPGVWAKEGVALRVTDRPKRLLS